MGGNPVLSVGLSVTAVAAVLIVASVAARAMIARRGYLTYDDFPLVSMAEKNGLTPDYLFTLFNNHLMPAGQLVTWLTNHLGGFGYGPYLTLLVVAQAAVSIAFYRLLRLMLLPGWAILVPLSIFLFSPLTLEATSWWAVGVNMLPMQLAMVLAVGAQVRYMRTRRRKHLLTLGLSIGLGLIFFEKALLAVALVFLLTLCLYTRGGPFRSVFRTVRDWWQSWTVLTAISVGFLTFYLLRSTSSLRRPASVDEVITFVAQMFGNTLFPGLVGGPWTWMPAGDGAPITAPAIVARWGALAVVAAFMAFTVWLRGSEAFRAWLLVLLYITLVAGLLGATRLGSVYSGVAGAVPRYISDVVVVAAIAAGAALCGLRRDGLTTAAEAAPERPRAALIHHRKALPALAGAIVVLIVSATFTGIRFGDEWAVKRGRDYLATARADLAAAPAGTVFMDQPVPEDVVGRLSAPYNLQSEFFAPLDDGPVFVTQARHLSVFDKTGHVRQAWVNGVVARPGPVQGCGYRLTGPPVRIPLESSLIDYWHVVRIAYLSDRDTAATMRLGAGEIIPFDVHRGLNEVFLLAQGGGATLEVDLLAEGAGICTDEIMVGSVVPAPKG
ncbi:hypothetical protein QLQ12_28670 [Actinoplanes sp. NEAU-A12]|uniref:Glycosyltransferase RgtA/B/C/D-like domain-containing protein n=1 Tax=Actinoplanes sandaracinus TaxID=3045177 RepID=A0ABT6WS80_9ACTN|nr:hypothetical protein [Actinoplanes sandaracinus]MDI6102602.1 hypothetical protein [Actinoplanes sandaracinus]